MIGNTWPSEVCFRVRESSKPTVINQHSVKLPGNNLLTISAVGNKTDMPMASIREWFPGLVGLRSEGVKRNNTVS